MKETRSKHLENESTDKIVEPIGSSAPLNISTDTAQSPRAISLQETTSTASLGSITTASTEAHPKGILKKAVRVRLVSDPTLPKHLKWDEERLAETEAGKSATMVIDEPKTPYHTVMPIGSEDELNDVIRLKLNSASDLSSSESNTSKSSSTSSGKRQKSGSDSDWDDSDLDDPLELLSFVERKERREKFGKLRKKHYQMKEMIKVGRHLVESEEDDDVENGVMHADINAVHKDPFMQG